MKHVKSSYYFSHDANARYDPDICLMRADYNIEGYGLYWIIVEILRGEPDYKLKFSQFPAIAIQSGTSPEKVKQFIDDCINKYNLFKSDGEFFWSDSLIRRMDRIEQIAKKRSEAGKASARARKEKGLNESSTDPTEQVLNKCSTNVQQLNKIKENKIKENKIKYAEFVSMTEAEYQKLVEMYGERAVREMINILDNYKGAKGKRYKSDYRAILSWVVKRYEDDNKNNSQVPPYHRKVVTGGM